MTTDNRLKIFVAVAQSGSFTLAARSLGCTQPAVSQNIAQLESETGCALFERGRGSVSLTPSGRVFFSYAKRILSLYESMTRELADLRQENERLQTGRKHKHLRRFGRRATAIFQEIPRNTGRSGRKSG